MSMKMKLLATVLACLFPLLANAEEDPAHNELRAVRDGLLAGGIVRRRQATAPLPQADHAQDHVQNEQQHGEVQMPREIQARTDGIDHHPPMPVLEYFARDQKGGEHAGPGHHRIREGQRSRS